MPGRRVSHSESRWVQLPHTVIRCNGTLQSGKRCRREAIEGSVVCEVHGGLAPQVRRRAAERLLVAADEAIQVIKSFISDPTVPAGVRLKAAQDIADRAGLAGVQMHQIIPMTEDPIMRLFEEAFSDPSNWESNPPPDPTPAIESYPTGTRDHHDAEREETVEAEIVEPEGEPATRATPMSKPRMALTISHRQPCARGGTVLFTAASPL